MTKSLYLKKRVLDDDQIERLLHIKETGKYSKAGVSGYSSGKSSNPHAKLDENTRKCLVCSIEVLENPDISSEIVKLGGEFMPGVSIDTHFSRELQILRYDPGGKFIKHRDTNNYDLKPRLLTCVTLLEKSDDLEGGDLVVYPNKSHPGIIMDLEPYESVIFNASTLHECTELISGTRFILISWVHEYDRSADFFERKSLTY